MTTRAKCSSPLSKVWRRVTTRSLSSTVLPPSPSRLSTSSLFSSLFDIEGIWAIYLPPSRQRNVTIWVIVQQIRPYVPLCRGIVKRQPQTFCLHAQKDINACRLCPIFHMLPCCNCFEQVLEESCYMFTWRLHRSQCQAWKAFEGLVQVLSDLLMRHRIALCLLYRLLLSCGLTCMWDCQWRSKPETSMNGWRQGCTFSVLRWLRFDTTARWQQLQSEPVASRQHIATEMVFRSALKESVRWPNTWIVCQNFRGKISSLNFKKGGQEGKSFGYPLTEFWHFHCAAASEGFKSDILCPRKQ